MKMRELPLVRPRHQSADGPRHRNIKIRVPSRAFPPDFFVKGTQKALGPTKQKENLDRSPTPDFKRQFAFSFYREQPPVRQQRKRKAFIFGELRRVHHRKDKPVCDEKENGFQMFVLEKLSKR